VTGNDVTWPQVIGSYSEVTSFDRKSTGSGCRRLKTGICCAFDFQPGFSSQEEAVTSQEMTSRELRWPEVTSFVRKSPRSGCRRPKTGVYCAFHFLQGCTSQEEAITWQEMTSVLSGERKWPGSDFIWPEVTWKWL